MNLFSAVGKLMRRWRFPKARKPARTGAGKQASRLGPRGERAAERYLRKRGYVIVGRGLREASAELDLVAVDGRTVVFVEVKTRSGNLQAPAESVDFPKQQRLTRAALAFLKRHQLLECRARFDVLALTWPPGTRRPEIVHIENAFPPTGRWQFYN